MAGGRIKGLDGVRALAVAGVFASHRVALLTYRDIGHVGVLTFFALSGFLIIGILHDTRLEVEDRGGAWAAMVEFFRRRTLRIFPVYYLTLAVLSLLAASGLGLVDWWRSLPWHALYATNLYEGVVLGHWQPTVGHFWSLAVEEQFYLLAAPLLILMPSRWHLAVCVAVVGAGLWWHAFLVHQGENYIRFYTDSFSNFAAMGFGGGLRLAFRKRDLPYALPISLLSGAALLGLAILPGADNNPVPGLSLALGGFAGACLVLSVAKSQSGLVVRILEAPPLKLLGQVSYGFYIFHAIISVSAFSAPVNLVANFAISFGLAVASWRLIEQPIIRWGRSAGQKGHVGALA